MIFSNTVFENLILFLLTRHLKKEICILSKQERKRPLDSPNRMIERREKEGERERERWKERYREGGRNKREKERERER